MTLKDIVNSLQQRNNWKNRYATYVPKFIDSVKQHLNWEDWDKDVFHEFFEKSNNQCVSSLQQGYFNNKEKLLIKDNWSELSILFQRLANNQETLNFDLYEKTAKFIKQHTTQNRQAATNRLIASLQPQLLCTVVAKDHLKELYDKLKPTLADDDFPEYDKNNWFKSSNNILRYFKSKLGVEDSFEIMTYPWQIKDDWNYKQTVEKMTENEFNRKIKLLTHKKQIILQGPPGTGKTRLAKEIAKKMGSLSSQQIKKSLKVNSKIANASGAEDYYTVKDIKENGVVLVSERTTQDWEPTYNKIIEKYNQLVNGETPENQNGLHPYELAVAKHFFNKNDNHNYQLIQFHPSYTYEDFVRGITVKSGEDGLEYITENKILGKIAKEAHQNYLDSKKESSEITKEKWLEEQFEKFIEEIISPDILNKGGFKLNTSVSIDNVHNSSFRYFGINEKKEKWISSLVFEKIITCYNKECYTNKEIDKLIKTGTRSTYYRIILEKFKDFLVGKVEPQNTNEKIVLKNYVLIIDEINRANLSSVLGELIYALEYRGEPVESMYEMEDEGNTIVLPPNLYIIGTMNTADRSVGQIDYAIRRRFAFVDVLPKVLDETTLDNGLKFNTDKFNAVAKLFIGDNNHLSEEFNPKDVQLGHSYFIYKNGEFDLNLEYEIKPILREYVADGILKESALEVIENL